jgi:CheY-like chemotaxis protein
MTAPRILIVEDEVVVALFMEDILGEFGYAVAGVVCHLDEAMARERDYDLAVLDVHINGRSVFDFADKLSAEGVPFVFATGYGEAAGAPGGFDAPVIRKPYDVTQVASAVAELLRARPLP